MLHTISCRNGFNNIISSINVIRVINRNQGIVGRPLIILGCTETGISIYTIPVTGSCWPGCRTKHRIDLLILSTLCLTFSASIWIAGLDEPVWIASKARSPLSIADSVPGISKPAHDRCINPKPKLQTLHLISERLFWASATFSHPVSRSVATWIEHHSLRKCY